MLKEAKMELELLNNDFMFDELLKGYDDEGLGGDGSDDADDDSDDDSGDSDEEF